MSPQPAIAGLHSMSSAGGSPMLAPHGRGAFSRHRIGSLPRFLSCISDKLGITINLVRVKGLEPLRLMATDFKSVVTTNFTTPAFVSAPSLNRTDDIGLFYLSLAEILFLAKLGIPGRSRTFNLRLWRP